MLQTKIIATIEMTTHFMLHFLHTERCFRANDRQIVNLTT